MRDSRRDKGFIDELTVEVEGMVLYKGKALEKLDHYVDNLPYMVHKKYLDAMCDDANSKSCSIGYCIK